MEHQGTTETRMACLHLGKLQRYCIWKRSGCGRNKILYFSPCTLVDRVKACISFVCALKGLPPGRQALTCLKKNTYARWPPMINTGKIATPFGSSCSYVGTKWNRTMQIAAMTRPASIFTGKYPDVLRTSISKGRPTDGSAEQYIQII